MDLVVKAEKILELKSKEDWILKIPRFLPSKRFKDEKFLFIDKNGFSLMIGKHFDVATELDSYPIGVYRVQTISSID